MTHHHIDWYEHDAIPCQGGALTIGNFDGVHRGHQALLAELHRQADISKGPAVVLTFDPHPEQLLRPQATPHLLTTIDQRAALLTEHGADVVLILRTTSELLRVRAREFFARVVQSGIQPRTLVPGFNFRFGHNREGSVDTLQEYCREAGVNFVLMRPALFKDETISSSRIRAALLAGNVRLAESLLGRPYSLTGVVGEGEKRGRTIGFPTANLEQIRTLAPANGVYAATARWADQSHPAAVNIGPNPTFGEDSRKIEAHLIGFFGDLYKRILTLEFAAKLRETQKFASAEELVGQLQVDIQKAQAELSGNGANRDGNHGEQ